MKRSWQEKDLCRLYSLALRSQVCLDCDGKWPQADVYMVCQTTLSSDIRVKICTLAPVKNHL